MSLCICGAKGFHEVTCPADTRPIKDRIAQAIGDPGSVVGRRLGPTWVDDPDAYADEFESPVRWSTRAVLALLESIAPHHEIEFSPAGWVIAHSMRCRLNGDLFGCPINKSADEFVPHHPVGRYRCDVDDNGTFVIGEEVLADA